MRLVTWQLLRWVVGMVVETGLGEVVYWVRRLKPKSGVLMDELNLKACGENDTVR
jgi:hypothetical protein